MAPPPLITRFAPSPTGFLHLGHMVSALFGKMMAGEKGHFLLRVEDIDSVRCTPILKTAMMEDLRWLGLLPSGDIRCQSEHLAAYQTVLDGLRERGLLYACSCTRREIAAQAQRSAPDGSPVYAGMCRHKMQHDPARPLAWRLDMQRALEEIGGEPCWTERGRLAQPGVKQGQAAAFGDVVLARRDYGVSYHLCVTHDDALQKVSCVTRGIDLLHATSVQRVLQELMGWSVPLYAHHGLVLDAEGRKLSKRDGVVGIRALRAAGQTPEEVLNHPLVRKILEASLP